MKAYLRRSQTLIKKKEKKKKKKKKQKHNNKPANNYNSRSKKGEVHWLAHGGQDGFVLR